MEQKEVFGILSKENICHYFSEISQIHMYTKHYLLICEEISEAGITFLQPLKEHRDAYDHLTRIFALPMRDIKADECFDKDKYALENVKKAFGHEYRAFFDTADWFTYICRQYIREELSYAGKRKKYQEKYDDFDKVKEFINKVPFLIAEYREGKDVSNNEPILGEVLEYKKIMDELLDIYNRIKFL